MTIEVARHQDQSGPLHVQIINLPPGWSSVGGRIAEGEYSATILLQPNAMAGELGSNWRCLVRNSDSTGEKSVSGIPGKIIQPSSVAVVADVKIIQCTAGEVVRLPIRIKRSGNFNGRVPVEVRGLPAGVRIQDVGLNGIPVPPGQDSRILQIEVDSWVETGLVGMSLVAKEEGKGQTTSSAIILAIKNIP